MPAVRPSADASALLYRELQRINEIAFANWGIDLSLIPVTWNQRGRSAGSCSYRASNGAVSIKFNPTIANAEGEAFVRTIAHEYAHAVQFLRWHALVHTSVVLAMAQRASYAGHGNVWKRVMQAFGRDATRCHNYASATYAVRTYAYSCLCKGWQFTSVRHNKARKGAQYRCPKCKGVIVQEAPTLAAAAGAYCNP